MTILEIIAFIWVALAALHLIFGVFLYTHHRNNEEQKTAARTIILAPIAPIALAAWAVREIIWLWHVADFKTGATNDHR